PGTVKRPRRRRGTRDDERALLLAVIRAHVLDTDDRRLRASQLPPQAAPNERRPAPRHAPVQIVRSQKRQVAADVPVAADDVVRMTRYVLLVPGEHDQVVPARELVAAANGVEVVVGEEVDALPGPVQPGDEVEIPVVEAEGNSEVEE